VHTITIEDVNVNVLISPGLVAGDTEAVDKVLEVFKDIS